MFRVNNKDTRTMSITSFWCLHCKLSTYSTTFSSVSSVDFELVNACWVWCAGNNDLPKCTQIIIIRSNCNNINHDKLHLSNITYGIMDITSTFRKKDNQIKIMTTGLLPKDKSTSNF